MAPALSELVGVTDTVHLARTHLVNWAVVIDGDGVLLIDAGFPGQRAEVRESLQRLGADVGDVTAILLTHAHVDHFGTAIWLAAEHHIPVYCHADEVGHAQRQYLEQASPAAVALHVWQPRWLRWTADIARQGAFVRAGIPSAQPLTSEIAATLPGAPMPIPTPGHTGGHCSYLVDGVLVSGDALVTGHPTTARRGPQLLHQVFNHDEANCVRSLAALALLETDVLLPGHGEVWHGPISELAEQAAPG